MFNIAATPEPEGGIGRWRGLQQRGRRLSERIQLRLETLRGRRIDLNLERSRKVKFNVKRDRDDDDDEGPQLRGRRRGDRVFVGERGRVTAWSEPDDEVNSRLHTRSI